MKVLTTYDIVTGRLAKSGLLLISGAMAGLCAGYWIKTKADEGNSPDEIGDIIGRSTESLFN